jgi:hypothetical protein
MEVQMTASDYWLKRQTKAELIKRIRAAECVQDNMRLDFERIERQVRAELERLWALAVPVVEELGLFLSLYDIDRHQESVDGFFQMSCEDYDELLEALQAYVAGVAEVGGATDSEAG